MRQDPVHETLREIARRLDALAIPYAVAGGEPVPQVFWDRLAAFECGNAQVTIRGIEIAEDTIADFCRRHRIRRLAVFGSILRDDFRPDSDVDVLVEFEPGTRLGLKFFSIERELAQLFGRTVDLNTPQDLSRYFRQDILREAQELYVAA